MTKGRIHTVHYGTDLSTTLKFVDSISGFLSPALDLVIINNTRNAVFQIHNEFIQIINSSENLGYFGAIKYGIERFPISNHDYIVICNNDVEICDKAFFSILENKLNDYDIIAPSIKTTEGIEQNPHRLSKPSKMRKIFYRIYFSSVVFARVIDLIIRYRKKKRKKEEANPEQEIFSPHGAFLIFRSSYFEKGGIIDDGYFLYGEEDSIAGQAQALGLKIGFVPQLKIKHWESLTTGKGFSVKKYKFQKKAHQYIKKKYPHLFQYEQQDKHSVTCTFV